MKGLLFWFEIKILLCDYTWYEPYQYACFLSQPLELLPQIQSAYCLSVSSDIKSVWETFVAKQGPLDVTAKKLYFFYFLFFGGLGGLELTKSGFLS